MNVGNYDVTRVKEHIDSSKAIKKDFDKKINNTDKLLSRFVDLGKETSTGLMDDLRSIGNVFWGSTVTDQSVPDKLIEKEKFTIPEDKIESITNFRGEVDTLFKKVISLGSSVTKDDDLMALYTAEKSFLAAGMKLILFKSNLISQLSLNLKDQKDLMKDFEQEIKDDLAMTDSIHEKLRNIDEHINALKLEKDNFRIGKDTLEAKLNTKVMDKYNGTLDKEFQNSKLTDELLNNLTGEEKTSVEKNTEEISTLIKDYEKYVLTTQVEIKKRLVDSTDLSKSEKELEPYCDEAITELLELEQAINLKLNQLKEKKTTTQAALQDFLLKKQQMKSEFTTKMYGWYNDTQLKNELDSDTSIADLLNLLAENKQPLEEEKKKLEQAFVTYEKDFLNSINEINKAVEESKDVTSLENSRERLETLCEQAKFKQLDLALKFEWERAQFNGQKKQVLRALSRNYLDEGTEKALRKQYDKTSEEGHKITEQLKTFREEIRKIDAKEELNIQELESWPTTDWGELLINRERGRDFPDPFGIGFEKTVNQLKVERRRLKSEIAQAELKQADPKILKDLNNELAEIKLLLYHTLLQRHIDVIAEKVKMRKLETISLTQRNQLTFEIGLLNKKYDSLFAKYKAIKPPEKSFLQSTGKSFLDTVKSILTLGYFGGRLSSAAELERKKWDADSGYDITEGLKKFLSGLTIQEGETWRDVLKRKIQGFMDWSDKHPELATKLAGDIALTCSIISDQTFLDNFTKTMEGKAYSEAFLRGWKIIPEEEPPATEEDFEYRALADLVRCAPVMTTIFKTFLKEKPSLFDFATAVAGAITIQSVQRFIPSDYSHYVAGFTEFVRGKSFQEVMENQRNIQLFQIGGMAKQLVFDPKNLGRQLLMGIKIWTKTLSASRGVEKIGRIATQILFPIVAVAATVSFGILSLLGGPVTWVTAAAVGPMLLTSFFGTAKKIDNFWNTVFRTNDDVYARVKKEMTGQLTKEELLEGENIKKDLQNQRDLFINDAKKLGWLPPTKSPEPRPPLTESQSNDFETKLSAIILKYQKILNEKHNQWVKDNPKESITASALCVDIFDKGVIPEDLGKEITDMIKDLNLNDKDSKKLEHAMGDELINALINRWVIHHVDLIYAENAFKEKAETEIPLIDTPLSRLTKEGYVPEFLKSLGIDFA